MATFPSRLDAVSDLLDWMERWHPPAMPEALWAQAQTGLVEGFTNAVRHAHRPFDSPPPVRVRLRWDRDGLLIEVEDAGAPFELNADDPEPERTDRWGLILLQGLQERHGWWIRYEPRPGGGNVLRLRHPINPVVTVNASG
jgi:serine/threonine-protein kinase RsbW